jgi:hypothetical protein
MPPLHDQQDAFRTALVPMIGLSNLTFNPLLCSLMLVYCRAQTPVIFARMRLAEHARMEDLAAGRAHNSDTAASHTYLGLLSAATSLGFMGAAVQDSLLMQDLWVMCASRMRTLLPAKPADCPRPLWLVSIAVVWDAVCYSRAWKRQLDSGAALVAPRRSYTGRILSVAQQLALEAAQPRNLQSTDGMAQPIMGLRCGHIPGDHDADAHTS